MNVLLYAIPMKYDYTGTQKLNTPEHTSALIFTDLNIFPLRCIHTLTHMTNFPWALPKQILGPSSFLRTCRDSARTLVPGT